MLLTSILSHFSFSIDNFQYFAQLQGFLLCISWQQLGQGGVCFPSVRAGIAKDFGPSVLHRTTCQPGISGSGRVLLSTDLHVCFGLCCQGCLSRQLWCRTWCWGRSGCSPCACKGEGYCISEQWWVGSDSSAGNWACVNCRTQYEA